MSDNDGYGMRRIPKLGEYLRIDSIGMVGMVISVCYSMRKAVMIELEFTNFARKMDTGWWYLDYLSPAVKPEPKPHNVTEIRK